MESWRAKLAAGDVEGAWNEFIARYRRLILATIRRTIGDDDDVDDVFAEVCANLSADDLLRLERHNDSGTARLSTWIVTVVHHQTIDWVRRREGRVRIRRPGGLSPIQQEIFQRVFAERRSHVEAYELFRQNDTSNLPFSSFLKEIAETYRAIERALGKSAVHYFRGPPAIGEESEATAEDAVIAGEKGAQLAAAIKVLPVGQRLAVQLFVIDELAAEHVARAVGWPNAKAVYNRVHRALAVVRKELERAGFQRTDVQG